MTRDEKLLQELNLIREEERRRAAQTGGSSQQVNVPGQSPQYSQGYDAQDSAFGNDSAFGYDEQDSAFGTDSAFGYDGQDSAFGNDSAFGSDSAFGYEDQDTAFMNAGTGSANRNAHPQGLQIPGQKPQGLQIPGQSPGNSQGSYRPLKYVLEPGQKVAQVHRTETGLGGGQQEEPMQQAYAHPQQAQGGHPQQSHGNRPSGQAQGKRPAPQAPQGKRPAGQQPQQGKRPAPQAPQGRRTAQVQQLQGGYPVERQYAQETGSRSVQKQQPQGKKKKSGKQPTQQQAYYGGQYGQGVPPQYVNGPQPGNGADDMKKKKKKKKHPILRLFRNILIILLVLVLLFGLAVHSIYRRFDHIETAVAARETSMKSSTTNILLIGQDAREGQGGQRSDTIILMTINRKKNKVILTSFMRDMYVQIPGYGGNRINAAFAFGGVDLLDQTIEENFGITIDANMIVDLEGFLEAMTAVGSLEIELTAEEAQYMNEHPDLGESVNSEDAEESEEWIWHLEEGVNTLTPHQLLAYSRMRHLGNSDWDRTERQRKVVMAAINKVKHGHFLSGLKMAKNIAPHIATDVSYMGMMKTIFGFLLNAHMESYRLPVDGAYSGQNVDGMDVLVPDMQQNIDYLHSYMAGEGDDTEE